MESNAIWTTTFQRLMAQALFQWKIMHLDYYISTIDGTSTHECNKDVWIPHNVIKDAYPIPRIDESLLKLGLAKFFATLNLGSAFW